MHIYSNEKSQKTHVQLFSPKAQTVYYYASMHHHILWSLEKGREPSEVVSELGT